MSIKYVTKRGQLATFKCELKQGATLIAGLIKDRITILEVKV